MGDSGRLSLPDDTTTDRVEDKTEGGRELGLPTFVNGDGVSGLGGGGYVCSLHPEHSFKFIATKSIMDLFLAVERRPDVRLYQRWWEHENLDLEASQAIANVVEVTDRKGMEEDEDKKV